MDQLLYGAAYYDEYMPYERLDEDVRMMKEAGINTVRIAESTWSTCEAQEGVFDFSHVIRVMDAMEKAGINVIIGTPTYAVPTWMVKSYPEVLATTKRGHGIYGARQIMDMTNHDYRFFCERVIRKLMEVTAHRPCVIGFQIDNECKHFDTAGPNVQRMFISYLKKKFNNDLDAMNYEFGFDYWSNRINAWEDFPDVRGTINGSFYAEFEKFQRTLVDEFLNWQAAIVSEYKRPDQFITHNFDFEWRGYSYGVQPLVNHKKASTAVTIAGCDIYHPNQDELTGEEIAMGGDITRSLKNDNYLVIETEAQGFPCWTPYPGQLRLCAYSHLASGADSVMYWHWHSLHNACETYWKGILSHDFQKNPVYDEVSVVGNEWKKYSPRLVNLKKKNETAILISNEALTALEWFKIEATSGDFGKTKYNDVFRWIYNALFRMNIECDIIWPETKDLSQYKMIVVPALYAAPQETIDRLKAFVKDGGVLVSTFKTAFTNENVKVYADAQPHGLTDVFGMSYNEFTFPKNVDLAGELFVSDESENSGKAETFMELLNPETAEVLASYVHPAWGRYAAITGNSYGDGLAYYIGCMTDNETLSLVLRRAANRAGIALVNCQFPVIVKQGVNEKGETVRYYLNYSWNIQEVTYANATGYNLFTGESVRTGDVITIKPWDLAIIIA